MKKPAVVPAKVQPTPSPTPAPAPESSKKNERPQDGGSRSSDAAKKVANFTPTYFYEFNRPGFLTARVIIEHDASGKGRISFEKKDFNELVTDPIQLSAATVEGIDAALARLDFWASTEDYQYEKDLSNMGQNSFKFKKNGRERAVKFNWTTNKDAKFLMDEYRRISNEYVWKFDMVVARENQPLESPRMLDGLDMYVQRGEITDPPHIIPFLKELSEDERLPLIARNHASRIIKHIEKTAKKPSQ